MSTSMTTSWLDKNFLEKALGEDVVTFEVNTLGDSNDFFTSTIHKTTVELKSGKKEYLIIKKLIVKKGEETSVSDSSMFDRETHMYGVVMPKLSALLEKAFPGMAPLAPRHYYSSTGVLVLEDLSVSGFEVLDRRTGLNLDQSLQVMRALARFHGASVILYQQDPQCFKPYMHSLFSEQPIQELLRNFFPAMTRLLAEDISSWPGYDERYSKKLKEMADSMRRLVVEGTRRQKERFNVLTHDDIWICNVMFRPTGDVRLIDFQMPHYASPGNDLQLIFTTSLMPDVRRNHLNTLIQEYHKVLCETLTALKYTKKLPTLEDIHEEYRKSCIYGFVIAVVYLPGNLMTTDCEIPMFDPNGRLPDRRIYENSTYRETMQELMKHLQKQGAFTID